MASTVCSLLADPAPKHPLKQHKQCIQWMIPPKISSFPLKDLKLSKEQKTVMKISGYTFLRTFINA